MRRDRSIERAALIALALCGCGGPVPLSPPDGSGDAPDGGASEMDAGDVGGGRCGDGARDPGEACDDGDTTDLGDCNASCTSACAEPGHAFGFDGACYFRPEVEVDYAAAEAACAAAGAELATLGSMAEQQLVELTVCRVLPCLSWLGLNDRAVEGTLAWVSGEPVAFTHFAAGEPNDAGGDEDCVTFGLGTAATALWNDLPCTSLVRPLCERAPAAR